MSNCLQGFGLSCPLLRSMVHCWRKTVIGPVLFVEFLHGLYTVTTYIMLFFFVASLKKDQRPRSSIPCSVILLWTVFAIILRQPPGLKEDGKWSVLLDSMVRGDSKWRFMTF